MEKEKPEETTVEAVVDVEPTPVDKPAEPVPEETPDEGGKSRPRWIDLAERYGNNGVDTEDEAFDVISEELESLTAFKQDELAANERLIDTLNAEPDFKEFVGYMLQGASFKEALARTIDIESLTPAEGAPDRAAWDTARTERINRLKAMEDEDRVNMERVRRIAQNTDDTKALIAKFASDHKMQDEERREMERKLAEFASDILEMKVDEGTLDMIFKSMRMDDIIEQAKEDGAVGERNRKIETMRMSKAESGGLPTLDAGMGEPEDKEKGLSGFFDDLFEKRNLK